MLLGTLFDRPDRPLQVLIPTSIILFFLAGAAWPLSAMPGWVAALAHVSPATLGAQVFVRLNEMGAPLRELTLPLIGLALLATGYGFAGYVRATRLGGQRPTQSDT
jgi:ABC-2 type transport system permease protein